MMILDLKGEVRKNGEKTDIRTIDDIQSIDVTLDDENNYLIKYRHVGEKDYSYIQCEAFRVRSVHQVDK